jgi:hypothetical protein
MAKINRSASTHRSSPTGITPSWWHDFKQVYSTASKIGDSALNPDSYKMYRGKNPTAVAAGRFAADFVNDLTRRVIWNYNHPLSITNEAGRWIGRKAGFGKTYNETRVGSERVLKPGIYDTMQTALFGIGLTNAMDLMAGNFNLANLGEAGRPLGYQAVLASEDDPRQTTNVPLEYVSRYLLGRTGRVLPWDEFKLERPEISKEQYDAYRDYMRGDTVTLLGLEKVPMGAGAIAGGLAGLALRGKSKALKPVVYGSLVGTAVTGESAKFLAEQGVLKGTMEGIDGAEIRMLGYRMPFHALAGTALLGGAMYHYGNKYTTGQMPRLSQAVRRLKAPRVSGAPAPTANLSPEGGRVGK